MGQPFVSVICVSDLLLRLVFQYFIHVPGQNEPKHVHIPTFITFWRPINLSQFSTTFSQICHCFDRVSRENTQDHKIKCFSQYAYFTRV